MIVLIKLESILFAVVNRIIPKSWNIMNPLWKTLSVSLIKTIKGIYKQYNNVKDDGINKLNNYNLESIGGRLNYDFLLTHLSDLKFKIKLEFKHNTTCVDKCPQFLSLASNQLVDISYAEYFYDNYIPLIAKLYSINPPQKDKYLQYIHINDYTKDSFFNYLYKNEKQFINEKLQIVKDSIDTYLQQVDFNMNTLTSKMKYTQHNKIFLCWDTLSQQFLLDTIENNELSITKLQKINNKNTLVFETKTNGALIYVLLRWKNHNGILFPAWQISLKRNKCNIN